MHKKLLFITLLWLGAISSMAQSLTIVEDFKIIENSSALVAYYNQFGDYEKPAMDDTFPYAVVRVLLEGNAHEVTAAKKMLGVYTGLLSEGVKASYLDFENEILFLVPSNVGHVELSCGDGCTRQIILHMQHLQSNAVYVGKVHYTPANIELNPINAKKQIFSFEVNPKNASVEVLVGEKSEYCKIEDDIQSITLNHGTYKYIVSAPRYQTETGIIQVSDSTRTKSVQLLPDYGWLTLSATESNSGASVYVINTTTKERIALGNIPLASYELDRGEYLLQIFQNKYKDYTKKITILPNETIKESPVLEPNFISLTLSTDTASEIFVNGESYGKGQWSGTLELGEYAVETRKNNHRSSYIPLTLTHAEATQTITLAEPTPICGSLMVSGSPAKASIYIDDKYVGESPMIVNDLLIGEHEVRVERDGFVHKKDTIQINEAQESTLQYSLSKLVLLPSVATKINDLFYVRTNDTNNVAITSPPKLQRFLLEDGTLVDLVLNMYSDKKVQTHNLYLAYAEDTCMLKYDSICIPTKIKHGDILYTVNKIGDYAFALCSDLQSVDIPNSVTDIGKGAFFHCPSLKKATIPEGVNRINDMTFIGCLSLTEVYISPNVTSIGEKAFQDCESLTSITIPNNVTSIEESAFEDCKSLTSITIPNSVTSIGERAFYGCEDLTSIIIPNSVNNIGDRAFHGTQWLANQPSGCIYLNETLYKYKDTQTQSSVHIRNGIKHILSGALSSCDNLIAVTIPESVVHIGDYVVAGCNELTSIKVEKENLIYDSRNNCNAIIETKTNKLIAGCRNTVIPNSVTSIGKSAFFECSNLTSITIPNSVDSIEDNAFSLCYNLQTIYIPRGTKAKFAAMEGLKGHVGKLVEK